MKTGLVLIGACLALACAGASPEKRGASPAPQTRLRALREAGAPSRVVLITIAGLESSDYLGPAGFALGPAGYALGSAGFAVGSADAASASADASVRMPVLGRLAAEGVTGLRAWPPAPGSTYASHATLVTGLRPDRHGIVADEALDPAGQRALPYHDSRLLKATTLWDAALGRGVLAFGWPTTVGARVELLVPDVEPDPSAGTWLGQLRTRSTPQLVSDLEAIAREQLEATPKDAVGTKRTLSSWPTVGERDAAFVELGCRVAASERNPSLWLIRLVEPAAVVAAHGQGSHEHALALARADARIGRLVDCLGAAERLVDTAIVVVGDVAHRPVHTEIAPNTALVRENLIGRDPRSKTGVRSWLALTRSHGRSAYLFAKDAESAVAARRVLDAEAARSGAFEVVPAAELAAGGADPQAWFGLAARPGYGFGNALMGPLLRPSEVRSAAGGLPSREAGDGAVGFVAWGRGVREQIRVPELALVDVAPTIARLLGLRLDEKLDGRPQIGLLRASQPLPPPGPKRLGVGTDGDVERTLREMGGGRELGSD
ncbi:MAG: alkaline phosphatase family protein [Deltaproteobacteria bacterium]|nr:alkaline phosphatase family protein [Deltaproteobacteria bacterium]